MTRRRYKERERHEKGEEKEENINKIGEARAVEERKREKTNEQGGEVFPTVGELLRHPRAD